MLSDKNYRKRVVANVTDPVVKAFWEKEFSGYADKFASEAVSPIQNKVGQFLSSSLMRNIIGQVKSAIDIRDIMDNGKILIMNLSKGRIGEDNSALLGAMMITKIQLAAMSRVDVPEIERRDFYLYIDEFQNFSTDSFANILSEARKYRLNLILAHQYIEQLSEKVKPAVFGNVGTMVVFRVGAADAEELVKEFTPTFTEEDIVNLPKYEMYLKLMIDGIASSPFSARGLPPLSVEEKTDNSQRVIQYSREKYASERVVVEEKIMRWHQSYNEEQAVLKRNYNPSSRLALETNNPTINTATKFQNTPASGLSNNRNFNEPVVKNTLEFEQKTFKQPSSLTSINNERFVKNNLGYPAVCFLCGKETFTVFKPDGIRPVYCKDCLGKKKEEKRLEFEKRKIEKEIERKKLEEDDVIVSNEPVISLSDLNKIPPVDFKGRELKDKKPLQEFLKPISEKKEDNKNQQTEKSDKIALEVDEIFNRYTQSSDGEHNLSEDEDVVINHNQF
jgi:CxxC-x17-CxxC domain-containing protein